MEDTKPLRIAFMGTPDFVVPTMRMLHMGAHELVCVYTQPPRAKGRKQEFHHTPVHDAADALGVDVRHPVNFKDERDVKAFEELNLDIAVVAAYGLLLPQSILDAPKLGCLNIHPSLLPCWRGPAPIQYAIWKGDKETGVSVMQLEKAMDAGPVIAQERVEIAPRDNFTSLNETLWQKGNELLAHTLDNISHSGEVRSAAQDHDQATYCKLLTKEQGRIDWNQSAVEIDRQIRGLNPWPGTWCMDASGRRLKILEARVSDEKREGLARTILQDGKIICGEESALQLTEVQPENKKPMDIVAAINGGYIKEGEKLE
ncbi:MAG: methionyl-tRNA formyltransferase [Alphaproteobacteria bacterium]|nr:methionyl-tRNA formyltransferase [Alphaproteobacteria bacterium]